MKYRLLKESALRVLKEEDYNDVTQGELEDMGIDDPYEAGVLERPRGEDRWAELRKEVEAKYGPDWEGWWGDGYYKNGNLYQSPPDNTIYRMNDDGSAEVWQDGDVVHMTKDEMEDADWGDMEQRFPHGHDYWTSLDKKARDMEEWDPDSFYHGNFAGKNRKYNKKSDEDIMWANRRLDKYNDIWKSWGAGSAEPLDVDNDSEENLRKAHFRTKLANMLDRADDRMNMVHRKRWNEAEKRLNQK